MALTNFIAAIEISSSKLTGIAGRVEPDGKLNILALAETSSIDFMYKGMVFNTDKATFAIKSILDKLEVQLKTGISKIYIGINALSMHALKNIKLKVFESTTHITADILDELKDMNANDILNTTNYAIFDIIPQEYKVGIVERTSPVGVPTTEPLEGHYVNIVGRKSIYDNLASCFEELNCEVIKMPLSHIVSANLLLDDSKLNSGCAFVNFGAESTTLSIYKNSILRYFVVIPLGGNSLTKDLIKLKIDIERAEVIKRSYGDLMYKEVDSKDPQTIYLDPKEKLETSHLELNAILQARQEEIILNVWNQIQLSGFEHDLNEGIVITGGAASMKGLKEFIMQVTPVEKVTEAVIQTPELKYSSIIEEFFDGAQIARLACPLSILLTEEVNCAKIKVQSEPQELFEVEQLMNTQQQTEQQIIEQQEKIDLEKENKEKELAEKRARDKQIEAEKRVKEEALRIQEEEKEKEKANKKKEKKSFFKKTFTWMEDTMKDFSDSTFSDNSDNDNNKK